MRVRSLAILALPLLLAAGVVPQAGIPLVRPGDVVVTGGFLFDGVRDTTVPNTGIVIRSGIFQKVGANLQGVDLTGATVVKLSDTDYILPGLFDLHAHYAIDLFGRGASRRVHGQPDRLPGQRRDLDVSGRRDRSGRHDGGAASYRTRRADWPAHHELGAVLRHGPAVVARGGRDARAGAQGSGRVGGARRQGLQGQGHSGPATAGADRSGAPVWPPRDRPPRFRLAVVGQPARRHLHGHRPHRALHGRRRHHCRSQRLRVARSSSTSIGRKSTRS